MLLWLSVFCGVVATVLFVVMIVGISRVQSITAMLGISRVMNLHRWAATIVLSLIIIHVVFLVIANPANLDLLNPFGGTAASKSALLGTISLLAILWIARFRGQYYDAWRWVHLALAVLAVIGITGHLLFLGHRYVPWIATTAIIVFFLIRRWLWAPLRGRKYVVSEVRHERPCVATVILSPHRESRHARIEIMKFKPGQFAWVRLRRLFAREEHPYTIASSPDDNTLEFTVKYSPGSFSDKFANLTVGQKVFLDGPHGSFTPEKRDLVLVAAGVGITPMMSMLRTLSHKEDPRRMILIHVGSQPLFSDEITKLKRRLNLRILSVVGAGITAEALAGVLPARQRRHYHYYICGPPSLIQDTLIALRELEVPAGRIHTEQFASTPPVRDTNGVVRRDGRHRA